MKRNNGGAMAKNIKSYCMVLSGIAGLLYLAVGIFPRITEISGTQPLIQGLDRIEIFAIAAILLITAYLLYRSGKKGSVRKIIKTRYRGSVSGSSRLSKVLDENNMIIDNCMRQMEGPLNLDAYLRRSALLYEKVCECEALAPNISEYRELKRMVTDSFLKSLPAKVRKANNEAKGALTEKGRYRQMLSIRRALEGCSIPPDLYPAVQQQINKLPAVREFREMKSQYVPDDYLMNSIRMDIIDEKMISEVWGKSEDDLNSGETDGERDKVQDSLKPENEPADESSAAENAEDNAAESAEDNNEAAGSDSEADGENKSENAAEPEAEAENNDKANSGEKQKSQGGKAGDKPVQDKAQPSIFKEHSFTNRELRFFKSLVSSLESAGLDPELLELDKQDGNTYNVGYGAFSRVGRIRLVKDNNYMQYTDAQSESRELINPSRNRCITTIGKWIAYIRQMEQAESGKEDNAAVL